MVRHDPEGKAQDLGADQVEASLDCQESSWARLIRKVDWKPLGSKHLQDRKVVLHSDSAKSYKLKLSG